MRPNTTRQKCENTNGFHHLGSYSQLIKSMCTVIGCFLCDKTIVRTVENKYMTGIIPSNFLGDARASYRAQGTHR